MNNTQTICQKIDELFEQHHVFLNPNLKLSDLSEILNLSVKELTHLFSTEMEYSFKEMLAINRLFFARDLLIKHNIPYKCIWKISGFKSHKDFERKWEKVVN